MDAEDRQSAGSQLMKTSRRRLLIDGVVQGVGFRVSCARHSAGSGSLRVGAQPRGRTCRGGAPGPARSRLRDRGVVSPRTPDRCRDFRRRKRRTARRRDRVQHQVTGVRARQAHSAAKPRVAGTTEVTRTSRGHAHGNSASPGVGRPPGSDSHTGRSQGTFPRGAELPSGKSASAIDHSPSTPCGAPARITAVWITRLAILCDAPAARVKRLARNPYVLHRNFRVIPNSSVLFPKRGPCHPQAGHARTGRVTAA